MMDSKILLKLLSNGNILVDWSQLPRHQNARQCVIHYKSLNTNESQVERVSKKQDNTVLRKIQHGHLYEVHVCTIDSCKRILASSQLVQIQTKPLDQIPILRVVKTTPNFVHLEWEKPNNVHSADIQSYKLNSNEDTIAILPSDIKSFVVNDGESGRRYLFQIEMNLKNGKVAASIPVTVLWPGVTIPEHHVFINGCEQLIICWGDSTSINDGNIQSYTLHLFDSTHSLLHKIGPNSPDCRQVWIRDVSVGIYYYILEIKLANSTKSMCLKPRVIECGRDSVAPVLTFKYANYEQRETLSRMAYQLIKIRDNINSTHFLSKYEDQLTNILRTFAQLTDTVRIQLTIESKTKKKHGQTYRLFIDGNESPIILPGIVENFPIELHQRENPYKLSACVAQDFTNTKSKEILVEASGHFPFFCAHFSQQPKITSCSYLQTLNYEKQQKRNINQGFLKSPLKFNEIIVYDLEATKPISLPPTNKIHKISIYFFYLYQCIPSRTHLTYFAKYASLHRTQYNYISINCEKYNIEQMKVFTQEYQDIQCFTDFDPESVGYEGQTNTKPIHELLELDGVPTYFIVNFARRIAWKGRLCIGNQDEYNRSLDHILAQSQQQKCTVHDCELCSYLNTNDSQIDSQLNNIMKNFDTLQQQQYTVQTRNQSQTEKRCIFSMKNKRDNDY